MRGSSSSLLLLCLVWCVSAQDIRLGVVEAAGRAPLLAAMLGEFQDVEVAALEPLEPLAWSRGVCALAERGVHAALIGGDYRAMRLAGAAAARAGLPLLAVDSTRADSSWDLLQLYPHEEVLAQACADILRAKGWKRAVVLHEAGASAAALLRAGEDGPALLARQLPPPQDLAPLRNLLLVLKKAGACNFVVWGGAATAVRVLSAAQRVGLLAERHSYVIAAIDAHTRPLYAYSHGGANVTALRLLDAAPARTAAALDEWARRYARLDEGEAARLRARPPPALVLAHAGAELAAKAWRRLALPERGGVRCSSGAGSFHADTLLNYLRSEEWEGAAWEADGGRRALRLGVVELARGGRLAPAGYWAAGEVTWQRPPAPAAPPPADSMTNRTFTVLIAENKPYVMRRESTDRLTGNERFEGFCIDLIDHLAQHLSFNYTLVQVKGSYGYYDNVTHTLGMLGRLVEDPNVDFAITDLTITAEREHLVDFTTPFMNLGISILFRAPQQPEPKLFAFLHPFSNGVWLCLGLAYVGTSLVLYVVGRLCHAEWQNPYPCVEEPLALENQFTLGNALWFNLGAVLLQGSEIAPVAYGSRAVAGAWWLFALVITSSYTANLATLLAKKSNNELIHNVADLAYNELGITYGAKEGGSTFTFFQHSENKMYQDMYRHMLQHPMPKSNDEGIKKVMTENYAFLMESTTIEYEIQRNCDVVKVGSLLDSKGYGIAMKKNSTWRQALNLGLLALQEAGTLREMQRSWWEEKHGGGACKPADERENEKLLMKNFLGLFLVLVVGSALGVALSCADLAFSSARRARANRERFTTRFFRELRFVFCFHRSERPLQGSLSGSSRGTEAEEHGEEGEEGEEKGELGAEGSARTHSPVRTPTRSRSRRRSSMHAASLRLAKHITPPTRD